MHDLSHLFIDLRPPAGGLQRLQRSLARGPAGAGQTQRQRFLAAGGALALALLVLASLLPGIVSQQQQVNALRSTMRSALAPPAPGIRIARGAAIELATGNPGTRLYLVQAAPVTVPSARHDGAREMR